MGPRRALWVALAVGVLAFVGTACEPAPPPLTLDLDPSGTYEVLRHVLALEVDVSCPEPAIVYLKAGFRGDDGDDHQLQPYDESSPWLSVRCPGPAGQTFTTYWEGGSTAPTSLVIDVKGTTRFSLYPIRGPRFDLGVTDAQTVTFTRVLCWFGLDAPCTPA